MTRAPSPVAHLGAPSMGVQEGLGRCGVLQPVQGGEGVWGSG